MIDLKMQWRSITREAVKTVLRPLLQWAPVGEPLDGYTIILGVPWALRHLLCVNLMFVSKMNLTGLVSIQIVFDRVKQPGAKSFCQDCVRENPKLPLEFSFQPTLAGKIVDKVSQSKFYASLNWVTGVTKCKTRYAILHDFDLYPVNTEYFALNYNALRENKWHFSGHEYTFFDGLTEEDGLIGTWSLGIDAEWLKASYSPVDCFHAFRDVGGRVIDLDAFTFIESCTNAKGLCSSFKQRYDFAHVMNLCSTYLRYHRRLEPVVVWRLHYLWYLEYLSGQNEKLNDVVIAMKNAVDKNLKLGEYTVNFANVDATCANVLREELSILDKTIHGAVRPDVISYVNVFEDFLKGK